MAPIMQTFAPLASKTLHRVRAENCTAMAKKKLPRRKQPAEQIRAVQIFRANVRALLDAAKRGGVPISQRAIARAAEIPLRTFTHQLSIEAIDTSAPTLRTVQAVADAFGILPWLLLVEDFPAEIALSPQIQRTVQATMASYFGARPESRSVLDETAKLLPQRNKTV